MYNHEPPNYVCPMCQIAKGEMTEKGSAEADVVYRDDTLTAFIAGKQWPANLGHVVIIPNAHVENLYDISPETLHAVADLSQRIAIALKKAYQCDGVSVRQHNEHAGNQDVWHYHMHVFPRYEGDKLYQSHDASYWPSAEERKPYADKLKQALQA